MSREDISKELEAVETEKSNSDDDYFEEMLESEMTEPTDEEDAGADTSDKQVADSSEGSDEEPAKPSYEELAAQLKEANDKMAQLEKESKGRLSDTVKSRQEKREMKAELEQLKTAVSTLLNKRNDALTEDEESDKEDVIKELKRADVNFDDDDKAYVDLSDVEKKLEAETNKTKQELEELKLERNKEKAQELFRNSVNNILSEDKDALTPAWEYLQDAYKDFNEAVIAIQLRTGVMDEDGTIDQDKAIDLLQGSEELKEFEKLHPGIDPIKVARAFNTQTDFRNSLRDIANVKSFGSASEKDTNDIDETIKKAQSKPGSFASTENQAGGNVSLIDKISQLDTEDIMDFSDAEVAKIEAMLERQELEGE